MYLDNILMTSMHTLLKWSFLLLGPDDLGHVTPNLTTHVSPTV